MVRVIEAMYRNPKFTVKEMGNRSSERRQNSGIRQGCPLSPCLFIIVMTVIMRDINSKPTQEERVILRNGQPIGMEGYDKLLYADGTIILTSTKQAAEIIFHKMQEESSGYGMRFNQNKCILLGMNSLGGIQYLDGGSMPMAERAPYLGTKMSSNGSLHFEISTRIINTTTTLNKLFFFLKKAPVSTTWKMRVHGAVISSKLLYGLEFASLTNAEYERLDAFQMKALRKILGIKHLYHSHISNEVVMQRANQIIRLKEGRTITEMSGKLINRQIKFMARLLRAEESDVMKTCSVDHTGLRVTAGFKRTGRPRIKWYDQVMNSCFEKLVEMGLLLPNRREDIRVDEAKQIVLQTAIDREL